MKIDWSHWKPVPGDCGISCGNTRKWGYPTTRSCLVIDGIQQNAVTSITEVPCSGGLFIDEYVIGFTSGSILLESTSKLRVRSMAEVFEVVIEDIEVLPSLQVKVINTSSFSFTGAIRGCEVRNGVYFYKVDVIGMTSGSSE